MVMTKSRPGTGTFLKILLGDGSNAYARIIDKGLLSLYQIKDDLSYKDNSIGLPTSSLRTGA
jgi:hypothetical protein